MKNELNINYFYISDLYKKYKENDSNLDIEWKRFFEGFDYALINDIQKVSDSNLKDLNKDIQLNVFKMIQDYRKYGYIQAKTNPLYKLKKEGISSDREKKVDIFEFFLHLSTYNLTEQDLKKQYTESKNIQTIIDELKHIYLGPIGFEYMHIQDQIRLQWLLEEIEKKYLSFHLEIKEYQEAYYKIVESVEFERYLQLKYLGQKRFSLEGSESLIPLLNSLITKSKKFGIEEAILCMAHRGRLNVLANVLNKPYADIFYEFQNTPKNIQGINDAKYHLGYNNKIKIEENFFDISLLDNASHLESANSILMGYVRSKIDLDQKNILPIIIHGDSAISGQGISYEQIQMESLEAYKVKGMIHIILDNQLGYTLEKQDASSSLYCSDIAKAIDAPIFHVNGNDIEAVLYVADLAFRYREKFQKDAFIRLVSYRKYGHNEMDEPRFTQPNMYKIIDKVKCIRDIYKDKLIKEDILNEKYLSKIDREVVENLEKEFQEVQKSSYQYGITKKISKRYNKEVKEEDFEKDQNTKISKKKYDEIFHALLYKPENFILLKQLNRIIQQRESQYKQGELNWATAELLAYGSLLKEGYNIRLCGEDVQRGTFSHRHAYYYDQETGDRFCSLKLLQSKINQLSIYNSHLSEYGALGFEYGYSIANQEILTIWEAQFGDFINGAQIIIDQYIVSGEEKWGKESALILLLPHGSEGQGPEHSSARLERFLELSASNNLIILNMTTPGNLFHAIRRQLKSKFRKPLIIMSPKSLLRHKEVISKEKDILEGQFHPIIDDQFVEKQENIKKILFCSGKIYYDLIQKRKEINSIAIIRLEQIYPFPKNQLNSIIKKYKNYKEIYWVQEEPKNMGVWPYLISRYPQYQWKCIARDFSPSPSSGYHSIHMKEQQDIINEALFVK